MSYSRSSDRYQFFLLHLNDILRRDVIDEAEFEQVTVFDSPVSIWNDGGSLQTVWEGSQVIVLACWFLMRCIDHVECFSPGPDRKLQKTSCVWGSRQLFWADHRTRFKRWGFQTASVLYLCICCYLLLDLSSIPLLVIPKMYGSSTYMGKSIQLGSTAFQSIEHAPVIISAKKRF